jgi:uroporphyrinogen-III synthase
LPDDLFVRPLGARSIVVTRPRSQAETLAALIESAGGRALRYPAIEIEPVDGPALSAVIAALGTFDLAIFISRNAVDQGLARVRAHGAWPAGLAVAAVGAGTRRALESQGMTGVIAPPGPADSEALLGLLPPEMVAGRRVVVFRGEGGREMIASTLRARDATVEYAECYRRLRPATDMRPLIAEWSRGAVHAVTVSSGEALANLAALLGNDGSGLLAVTPLFVPHARVGEDARVLGIRQVEVAGPADDEMLAALVAYFGRAG